MEQIKSLSSSIVKDGVQAIVLVKNEFNFFDQKYIMVQDYNDRGRGDGILMYGLPGGAIEEEETPKKSILRELEEEIAFNRHRHFSIEEFGCYKKLRPSGYVNDNHLFVIRIDYIPDLKTNDPTEVSKVHLLTFREIINLSLNNRIHEGSIRLILNFVKGIKSGSLNQPVIFNGFQF